MYEFYMPSEEASLGDVMEICEIPKQISFQTISMTGIVNSSYQITF